MTVGVHSLDHFTITVPDLAVARGFYERFGLRVTESRNGLDLRASASDHVWGRVREGKTKRLGHITFGCYADDLAPLRQSIEAAGAQLIDPPKDEGSNGIWFRDPFGVLIELAVSEKVSPDRKTEAVFESAPAMERGAIYRDQAPVIHPRRLSHVLLFQPDVLGAMDFYSRALGVKLSDHSGDGIAFMHGIHGSDHHMIAFCKSDRSGYHHSSWDVGSVQEVGLGAMQMSEAGFTNGWGLGRHVLGSNYFHYVQDPWGSFAEYSADIDYISAGEKWPSQDHDAANSFYLWGPAVPSYFVVNTDA